MLVDYYPYGHWYVLDYINSDWSTAWMWSGSAPDTCPAHPRRNKGSGQKCWQYRDENGKYSNDGDITVTCSQHSKIYHKMSKWFSDTRIDVCDMRQLNLPELAKITFSSPISSDSLISTIILLFLNILMPPMGSVREEFESTFSQIQFDAINNQQKLSNYI